ncbi:DUF4956 domain-containing protein [Mangrovibacterium diazotrophicum]|uniref:Uncharacterized protein DUF4956 n=1 Tax=Mangrovibacterium diazotrophicum TaxID=1261403 RepID=A0A419VY82_9BACT|nr:DUF4956 domain-containing protein [Mangrovibacterium diazotrophicum]RKD88193.1 uncharacterized protein DUF4956 [Mangrovibacterium diazotrophicum]
MLNEFTTLLQGDDLIDLDQITNPLLTVQPGSLSLLEEKPYLGLLLFFGLNFIVTGVIMGYFYYRKTHRRDYLFTFIMVSTTIFLMVYLLESVKIKVGFALGLFAIFGILRYRTDSLPVREMTYLFVIIGISVINALSNGTNSIMELLITNSIFLILTWLMETKHLLKHTSSKAIIYERLDLLKPNMHDDLLNDIRERTGLNVTRFEIGQIDFKKKLAYIKIYYPGNGDINTADTMKMNQFPI